MTIWIEKSWSLHKSFDIENWKKNNTEITVYNEIGNDQSEGHLTSKESYVN